MYASFFGLKEKPFNLTPDPRYLYMSPFHKDALDHLLYGIRERKGFITITGGIGTGKTTLCRALLDRLGEDIKSAMIFNSFISDIELLRSINHEFGIGPNEKTGTRKTYIDELDQFLLGIFREGGNAVILIDEAQNLSRDTLEQVRMLSNLETEKEKLLQIILVGQPELKDILSSQSLRQLDERITVRYDLHSLSYKDIRGYVEHRLAVAGGDGALKFTEGTIKKIYAYSMGNPRKINSLCDRAMLAAYVAGSRVITTRITSRAVKDLDAGRRRIGRHMDRSWKEMVSTAFLILLLIIAAGFGGWTFQEDIFDKLSIIKRDDNRKIKTADTSPDIREDLILDDRQSLSGLIAFHKTEMQDKGDHVYGLNLIHYNLRPEHYVLLKKPFMARIKGPKDPSHQPRYLLVCGINGEGAVVMDSAGGEKIIRRDYLLENWGNEIICVYPFNGGNKTLNRGMMGPDVLKLQSDLNRIGYLLNPTGSYDEDTFRNIRKFQEDFGLSADGIAGPRTVALLYQMKDFDERH